MAKARADAEQGTPRPDLDAVNFVLTNPRLNPKVRELLEGSEFMLTTLQRLVETKDVQQVAGFTIQDGKLISNQSKERIQGILTEIVTVIATGKMADGQKFTVRVIDSKDEREEFITDVAAKHPKKKRGGGAWTVCGTPAKTTLKGVKPKTRGTPSTEEQPNLIPKKFKLQLPAGKINDIFVELKELDVTKRRHSVSILFRVFFELTLDDYIKKHDIQLPPDKAGWVRDNMPVRLEAVKTHVQQTKLLSDKELKPIHVAISNKHSFLAPDTLSAYVHSPWMNPNPLDLKISWADIQLFVERLWTSTKK
jgi:hypothetical protein